MKKKKNFLLLSLDDIKSRKVANAITNNTSQKILEFLSENESATETELSEKLNLPISSIHYNLEQLKKASLIDWENYHLSKKAKVVKHYFLSSKYIIITPAQERESFLEKIKTIISAFLLTILSAGFIYKFTNTAKEETLIQAKAVPKMAMYESAPMTAKIAKDDSNHIAQEIVTQTTNLTTSQITNEPTFWFLIGAIFALFIVFITVYILAERQEK